MANYKLLRLSLGLQFAVAGAGVVLIAGGLAPELVRSQMAVAQTPAAPASPAAAGPQRGTVKSISGNTLTVTTDSGPTVTITVPDGTKVQQLAPGSTDLKTATASQFSAIAEGDRVLVGVRAGDTPDTFTARVVVLMKSADIAQKNAEDQADWRKNGTGGIVSSVDGGGMITVTAGTKKVTVATNDKTEFRRFTGDSVEFKDAKPGTFSEIHSGDQIQARGTKSEDGSSVQATQVVSGSFKNLSGVIGSLDASSGKITIKDLATKKTFTVTVSGNSNLRKMPPQMAQMVAARSNAGGAAQGGGRGQGAPAGGGAAGPGGPGGAGGGPRGGGDLSQMITRMPTTTLGDLKQGDAVMIVASEPTPGSTTVTAVTVLSGVEPILTANPNGGVTLSGWSMGGGAPTE